VTLRRAAWLLAGACVATSALAADVAGGGRAVDRVSGGEPIASAEALRIGLATRVWPDVEFADRWRAYARDLAAGATEAYALTKEGLNAAWDHGLRDFLEVEASLQDRAGRSTDYAEGVRAFLEKRPAKLTGS